VAEYHVENLGCRASRADGEAIAASLRYRGFVPSATPSTAQLVILNTCSVTAEADRTARAFLRRIHRQNPAARIVVTGCYAQRAPQELAALPGVDAVVGNSHKALVPEIAAGLHIPNTPDFLPLETLTGRVLVDEQFAHSDLATLPFAADAYQTRPNLKVQDGCGNRCSFCIIPITRGSSRSIPLETCLDNVHSFVEGGGNELVLSGINLGRWGRDLQPTHRFEELVAAILEQTALPRLRLSSIEPMDWTADLLNLYWQFSTGSHPRLARHAHLPLQSGSDTILRRMHRRYRPWHYAERLAQIRETIPEAAIGADVMVGFPGETDALFEESYQFIASQPFTYLHLFPFSARPGTPAWQLHREQPVPSKVVKVRMAALRDLEASKSRTFRTQFVGKTLSAITLVGGDGAATPALSDNFLKLAIHGPILPNRLLHARITIATEQGLEAVTDYRESAPMLQC